MFDVILGNVFALLAAGTDSVSGTRKNPKDVLKVQIISQFFHAASSFVLKGYSAVTQNAVAIFRNLLAMSEKKIKWLEWVLTAAAVGLGVYFNNRGFIGLLPVVANFGYTVCVFKFNNEGNRLKIAFVINMVMFTIFNLFILNFVGALMDFAVAVTTFIAVIKSKKEKEE